MHRLLGTHGGRRNIRVNFQGNAVEDLSAFALEYH